MEEKSNKLDELREGVAECDVVVCRFLDEVS